MASSNKNKTLSRKNTTSLKDGQFHSDLSDSDESYSSSNISSPTDTDGPEQDEHHSQAIRQNPLSRVSSHSQANSDDPSPVALLDMLAEVASATLKSDPMIMAHRAPSKLVSPAKKLKKSPKLKPPPPPVSKDVLSLDQIRMLSDKLLVNMFSETTSDEIRRVYTYTCHLIPEKCHQNYSSFGNENKARMQMKTHLLGHIAQLLAEANTPGKSQRSKFSAEPLPARKKRLAAEQARGTRMKIMKCHNRNTRLRPIPKPKVCAKPPNIEPSTNIKNKHHTSNKSSKLTSVNGNDVKTDTTDMKKGELVNCMRLTNHSGDSDSTNNSNKISNKIHDHNVNPLKDKNVKANGVVKLPIDKLKRKTFKKKLLVEEKDVKIAARDTNPSQINRPNVSKSEGGLPGSEKHNDKLKIKDRVLPDSVPRKPLAASSVSSARMRRVSTVEEIIDTHVQPQHDHCYTCWSGKKVEVEDEVDLEMEVSSAEENDESTPEMCGSLSNDSYAKGVPNDSHNIHNFMSVTLAPPVPSSALPVPIDPSIGAIEVIYAIQPTGSDRKEVGSYSGEEGHLKPKRIRRINRIIVPEEFETESSDDEAENVCETMPKLPMIQPLPPPFKIPCCIKKKVPVEGSPEWERKLALKYIRMLRAKKKDERVALICKICKDKSFTAQATLMYHYRSHAGIKPFVCDICSTTFTRQHSLNYHMLIHNNKSRFTCVDCGRKFRHPSHFKEHMRRHTGETPFECADCGLRFKTRNTYKRHLKTRHGKLLTANGIMVLSSEEFLKVKTNPRKKVSRRKDKETQCPEVGLAATNPRGGSGDSVKCNNSVVKNVKIPAILRNSRSVKVGSNEAIRPPVETSLQANGSHLPTTETLQESFPQIKMEVLDDGYEPASTSKCYKMCMIGTL